MPTPQEILASANDSMEKSLHHLQDLLRAVRTSRASSALVDNIRVEYYGTQTPISQLASVSIPEPRQIVIKPFDQSVLGEIAKAILRSELGITPQNDGKILRLQMPPLSGEQRQKYAAKVKEMCEETRVAMRNGRRDVNRQADSAHKAGQFNEDDNRKLHERIQEALKEHEKKLDLLQDKKIAEIMEI